jgi:Ca2+-transporting ATPase
LLCTALLAAPPYLAPIADVMHLVPPTLIMWAVILGSSVAPLVVTQAVMLTLALLRQRF